MDYRKIAGAELNLLRFLGVLPETFEGLRVAAAGTPVYDLNGEELFRRIPLGRQRQETPAFVDIAVHPALGGPLVAVSQGIVWDEKALLEAAQLAARKRKVKPYDTMRFVAYSVPKVAVQFLANGQEVLMLELLTWIPVPPPRRERLKDEPPANFERWSFLEETPRATLRRRAKSFEERVAQWETVLSQRDIRLDVISAERFAIFVGPIEPIQFFESRELHYSKRNSDHVPCYELRGQETNVWCVGASVQMVLDFYRYEYTQVRLAQELGLGTLANPNGLPYSQDGLVVTVLENMSSQALDAAMNTSPNFNEFRTEILANRPLISFIPGHSRTVAGYTRQNIVLLGMTPFRGLLVYDPWPPNAGVITRWENFDTQTYRRTFTARVTLV
ncbi:MAG TPA: C39 family peptidase [Thermoanaerobaculia bacterium]|nr:C39 family peptidase [Thermoanaerobaculia bacterium]